MKYIRQISIIIFYILLILTLFIFPDAYIRLIESIRDLINAFAIYFCGLFNIPNQITPTVYNLSITNNTEKLQYILEEIELMLILFAQLIISKDNIIAYSKELLYVLSQCLKLIAVIMPFIAIMIFVAKMAADKKNNSYGKQSTGIEQFKKIEKIVDKVKNKINIIINYYKDHPRYVILYTIVIAFSFNFIQIIIEFFAYYLVFVTQFNTMTIKIELYKLIVDLYTCISFIPLWLWIIIFIVLFNIIRKAIADNRLKHREAKNCGFINSLPIAFMLNGTMGKGKTTLMTDMSISIEWMYKQKALSIMNENMSYFPDFQWIRLERFIRSKIKSKEIYSLASAEKLLKEMKNKALNSKDKRKWFMYDITLYKTEINNGISKIQLWDSIITYSKAFIIYSQHSPLLISNYSIRSMVMQDDNGNLPTLKNDMLKPNNPKYSHIIDYDMTRIEMVMDKNNPKKDMFEFGIISLTEIGKERGNQLELATVKKGSYIANQKNDGFNKWLKMIRHSATVDNFPFVRVVMDEQRPESISSDVRELCSLVTISQLSDADILLPFYALEELIHNALYKNFIEYYNHYRTNRSDETLFIYLFKKIVTALHRRNIEIYNQYGFKEATLQTENGTMDGKLDTNKYYILYRKIYADRFSTDCYSDYFAKKNMRSKLSLERLKQYGTSKATTKELNMQHSYFIKDITAMGDGYGNRTNDDE